MGILLTLATRFESIESMLLENAIDRIRRLLSRVGQLTNHTVSENQFATERVEKPTVGDLEKKASQLLLAGQIEAAADVFRELQAPQIKNGLVVSVIHDALMESTRSRTDESYVATLSDVRLDTGYWVVLDREKAYVKETYGRNFSKGPLVQGRVSPDNNKFIVAYYPSPIYVEEPCVLVGSDENYSHWLFRSLLKVWLVEEDPRLRGYPWLVGENLRPFQKESLDLLGVQSRRLVAVPRNVVIRCRQLFVPTQMRGNQGFRTAVTWLQGRFQSFMAKAGEAIDLLYISRKDAAHRFLVNEDELFASLAVLGFQRIEPGKMTVQEQILAFSRAKVIVAPHGASLTNIIFSHPGLHVVEISSSNILHMADFRWIAQELGHRITTIVSEDYAMDEQRKAEIQAVNYDYRVSVAEVLKAIHH